MNHQQPFMLPWIVTVGLSVLLGCSSTPNSAPLSQTDEDPEKNLKALVEVTVRPEPRHFSLRTGVFNQSEILSRSGVSVSGVLLEGQFESAGWNLFLQDIPVRIEENSHFKTFVPIRPPGVQFLYSASGPGNAGETGTLLIRVLPE